MGVDLAMPDSIIRPESEYSLPNVSFRNATAPNLILGMDPNGVVHCSEYLFGSVMCVKRGGFRIAMSMDKTI